MSIASRAMALVVAGGLCLGLAASGLAEETRGIDAEAAAVRERSAVAAERIEARRDRAAQAAERARAAADRAAGLAADTREATR